MSSPAKRVARELYAALEQTENEEEMDRGLTAAANNAWYFECAWEVANKVGGIYTVIRSKAGEFGCSDDSRVCNSDSPWIGCLLHLDSVN